MGCIQVYRDLVYTVTVNCAQEAAKCGVKRFVDVSTAQVYNSDKVVLDVGVLQCELAQFVTQTGH